VKASVMVETNEMRKPEETGQHWAEASSEVEDWDEIDVSDQLEAVDHDDAASPVAAPFELVDPASRVRASDAQRTSLRGAQPRPDPGGVRMSSETRIVKQTVVEAGCEFKGSLTSSCAVIVNGTIDGQVHAPTLNVSNTGALLGSVKTKTLRSQGTLSASVDADEVFLSGAIRSKTVIKTRRLEMRIASSNDSQLEVNFAASVLEANDASPELDSADAPAPAADGDSDSQSGGGWPSLAVAGDDLDEATARTAKSSRRSEALANAPKRR
jgi:hypothetical protein